MHVQVRATEEDLANGVEHGVYDCSRGWQRYDQDRGAPSYVFFSPIVCFTLNHFDNGATQNITMAARDSRRHRPSQAGATDLECGLPQCGL